MIFLIKYSKNVTFKVEWQPLKLCWILKFQKISKYRYGIIIIPNSFQFFFPIIYCNICIFPNEYYSKTVEDQFKLNNFDLLTKQDISEKVKNACKIDSKKFDIDFFKDIAVRMYNNYNNKTSIYINHMFKKRTD